MYALWFFKRYVSIAKINLKRGTPKIVYIIKMSDQSAFEGFYLERGSICVFALKKFCP